MRRLLKTISVVLAASMFITGCGGTADKSEKDRDLVRLNETIDADSKWINSSIKGAIDANTPTNVKDDFYTYVNKDFILENVSNLDDDTPEESTFSLGQDIITERLKSIISETEDPEAFETNMIGYDQSEIDHDNDLVVRFTNVAGDWESRNRLGAEPLKEYLEKIDNIETMDDLSKYMSDLYTSNFSGTQFVDIKNDQTYNDPANNHVQVDLFKGYILSDSSAYFSISLQSMMRVNVINSLITNILKNLGYSNREIKKILRNCYHFEEMIADTQRGIAQEDYTDREKYYTMEEMKALFGDYPIEELIEAYGYTNPEGYSVIFPQSAKKIGKLYKASNLNLIKDFYRAHTIISMASLLDRESYDIYAEWAKGQTNSEEGDGDTRETETDDKELDILLNDFTYRYMNEPLDAVYVSRYCSTQQKESLTELVNQIIDYYADMIDSEDWLSDEAKASTKEKLRGMRLNILYPDSYPSYSDVEFTDEDNLVDMIVKLRLHALDREKAQVGKKHETSFTKMSTTTMNAYYYSLDNSVNILAGIVVPEHMYDLNDPVEVRLAHLGMIVGHEISHGFDDNGIKFDKDGKKGSWWTISDTVAFESRAAKLQNFYSAIIPIPGGKQYSGQVVSGEAIADLGGFKCMLGIGKGIEGFDYDRFFKAYADLWKSADLYSNEASLAVSDNHPLAMLRVNVVVQQFEEFYDTYGVKPGDGMYLEPDKRICVW